MTPNERIGRVPRGASDNVGGVGTRPRARRSGTSAVLATYLVVFAVLALPWLRRANVAIASADYEPDNVLIVWVLAWIAHALVASPAQLWSPPINFPAPLQLTGSEHFASSQLLFAAPYWATGNAVLATNLVAFLSYPLGAFAMQRLLVTLGCRGTGAWVAGLLFALGPLRLPSAVHVVQYANLFLPLVALAMIRLVEWPMARSAAWLGLALAVAFFSSYYMVVLAALVATVWLAYEIVRGAAGVRAVVLAAAAGGAAVVLIAIASRPYLARGDVFDRASAAAQVNAAVIGLPTPPRQALSLLFPGFGETRWWRLCCGPVPLAFIALGLAAAGSRRAGVLRGVAWLGLTFAVVGAVFMLGPEMTLAGHVLPLPFGALASSPARFFRVPLRFAVITGFGTSLLAGAGLEHVCGRIGAPGARTALLVAAASAVFVGMGIHLCDTRRLLPIHAAGSDAPVYDRVGSVVHAVGDGPLAEMPPQQYRTFLTSSERRVGGTRHWLPSILDYTGYPSEHTELVRAALLRVPEKSALDDLVDMTHLRWLLLRPAPEWPADAGRAAFIAALSAQGAISRTIDVDAWTLVRLTREPEHPEWFAAIAAGERPGATVLGTPLAPLAPSAAVGRIAASVTGTVDARKLVRLRVSVTNLGDATWPVSAPATPPAAYAVDMVARWAMAPDAADPATTIPWRFPPRRDVLPGEAMDVDVFLLVPAERGLHDIELRLEQVDGTPFSGPQSTIRVPAEVR